MYLWVTAAHIIAVIAWMAALLYLPRLFVYHADVERGSAQDKTFIIMERRLNKAIMTPAMLAVFILGLWLVILNPTLVQEAWFQVKLVLVFVLAACHGVFAKMRRAFAEGTATASPTTYRLWNEVPTVLMIAIVILVIVRPF